MMIDFYFKNQYIEENRQNCRCISSDCEMKGVCCDYAAIRRAYDSLPYCLRLLLEEDGPDIRKIE